MNGKGDLPRPLSVPRKAFENNWDLAFGQRRKNVPALTEKVDRIEYGTSVIEKFRTQRYAMYQNLSNNYFGKDKIGRAHV